MDSRKTYFETLSRTTMEARTILYTLDTMDNLELMHRTAGAGAPDALEMKGIRRLLLEQPAFCSIVQNLHLIAREGRGKIPLQHFRDLNLFLMGFQGKADPKLYEIARNLCLELTEACEKAQLIGRSDSKSTH